MIIGIQNEREKVGKLAGILGISGNVLLCVCKIFAGALAGSVSVIADGINNLSDAISSVITLLSFKLSGKPADKDHPYGHQRIEYVATLILSFVILFVGYELVKTSVSRIINPVTISADALTVAVLVFSLAGKLVMNRMYVHFAKKTDSSVLKASAKDAINDVFATGALLVCVIVGDIAGIGLDGYAGLGVSAFIIWSGISLIKESVNPILGASPDKELVDSLKVRILSYDGIMGMHDLIVHTYGPSKIFASVHAEIDARGDILASHDLIDNIERDILSDTGVELVIHMDPIVTNDEEVTRAWRELKKIAKQIDERLTVHDFRIVRGRTHTNLIFDVVIPFEFSYRESEVGELIQKKITENLGKEYYCVISYDRS